MPLQRPVLVRPRLRGVIMVVLGVATTLLTVAAAQKKDPAGHWNGVLRVPGQELAFDVDLRHAQNAWTGDISIPAQNATDLPLTNIAVRADSVIFEIASVPGQPVFHGRMASDSIAGNLTQGGQNVPFSMHREKKAG